MQDEEDIICYLNHQMGEAEKVQFEERLQKDEVLQETLLHSKRIMNVVNLDTAQFKEELRSVVLAGRKRKFLSKFWQAASIILIAFASIVYLMWPRPSVSDLAASYLQPYPDIITSRSLEKQLDMSLYNQGKYRAAIKVFEPFAFKDDLLIDLYLGVSYLMSGQNSKAVEILNSGSIQDSPYIADFWWYQSLALIRSERYDEAKSRLLKLQKESTFYKEKSEILIQSLNN